MRLASQLLPANKPDLRKKRALHRSVFANNINLRQVASGALSGSMRVIALKALKAFWDDHPDAETALRGWYKTVGKASGSTSPRSARRSEAPIWPGRCVVFNIGGNKYRLIAAVHYQKRDRNGKVVEGRVYIRNVLTHREYDKGAWKNGCDC